MQRRTARRWVGVGLFVAIGVGAAGWGEEVGTRPGEEHGRGGHASTLPFTVSKETTGIVSPLHADGTPDYVAALNEKYGKGVTPENNAFVAMLEVVGTGDEAITKTVRGKFLEKCGGRESEGMKWVGYREYLLSREMDRKLVDDVAGEEFRARGRLWSGDDYPKLAEYVATREKYLDASKKAMGLGKYWMPVVALDGQTLNSAIGSAVVTRMLDVVGVFGERATMRMKGGDFEGFMLDVALMEHVARQLQLAVTWEERLLGLQADGIASRVIGAAAGSGTLTQGQCVRLWKLLDGMEPPAAIEETRNIENRWEALERCELAAMGKVELLPEKQLPRVYYHSLESVERDRLDWDAVLKRVNGMVDERLAAVKNAKVAELRGMELADKYSLREFWHGDGESAKKENETKEEYTERVAQVFARELWSWAWLEQQLREAEMQRKMARVTVALAGFRADKGKWPESLGELVPRFIKQIPMDIYSAGEEAEILYARSDGGVRVYSVGWNGKDDGGVCLDIHLIPGADDIVIGAGVDAGK